MTYAKKKSYATYTNNNKKVIYAYFHNRATLSSGLCPEEGGREGVTVSRCM